MVEIRVFLLVSWLTKMSKVGAEFKGSEFTLALTSLVLVLT